MNKWLIRRADFVFSRPVTKEELVEMIERGDIVPKDEICEANGYWFSIQDVVEVRKFFGEIRLQSMMERNEENTSSTNTNTTRNIDLEVEEAPALAASASKASPVIPIRVPYPTYTGGSVTFKKEAFKANEMEWTRQARILTAFLALIFFGILSFLWMGSR